MKRKLFAFGCLWVLLLSLASGAFAEELVIAEQEETDTVEEDIADEADTAACGEGLTWMVSDGVLTVSGEGTMYDFEDGAPWKSFGDEIRKVVISDGVESVGDYAFEDFDRLAEAEIGKDVVRLGKRSFASCDALTSISLPKAFRTFEEECLYSCRKLTEIHCAGVFPHFRLNCLWDTYCKIYFPVEAPWSVILIEELEDAFKGRIEFLASDGTDPYTPTEATETPETTEPVTVPTTAPTEVPTTAPTAVPATAPSSAPTETTEPETTAPVYTRDPNAETLFFGNSESTEATQPAAPARRTHSGSIGFAIVIFVLASLGIGMVIFRATTGRHRYED